MKNKELLKNYLVNYYSKEEMGYRLSPNTKLDQLWPEVLEYRQIKAEFLPFNDQQDQPFWFVLTPQLQETLHHIDSRGKDSLYRVVQKEIQDELIEQALIEEALFSSVIEGAFSTLRRARELIVEGKKPRDVSDQMVANNAKIMRYVLEHRNSECSLEMMHTLQGMVTEKTLDRAEDSGRFRDDLVYIRNAQGEIIYTAPPAETVESSMQALIDWINKPHDRAFIHPILMASILHTYFVYVHPYFDGNGRTARSLFYWYLLKHGYEFFRYFSISSIIQETRAQYYKALKDMEDCAADMTYVLLYMTKSIVQAIDVILQKIVERWRRNILFSTIRQKNILLNERQERFLKSLSVSKEKVGTIAKHQKDFHVVFETARKDLSSLERTGILQKKKQGRKFIYILNPQFLMPMQS